MSVLDFINNGQQRRSWLDENVADFVEYITPPNLRPAAEFVGQMNPIQGMSDSMSQFGVAIDPDRSMDERRRAAMQSLTEGLVAVAPAALSASGFMKPAQASMEGLLGWSPAGQQIADDMGQFLADEAGSLRLARGTDAEAMARDILDLRAAGRASEVTDDMMAKADPSYMFNNTPLPMDQASRMARADEMGFGGDWYHGTAADPTALRPSSSGAQGPRVYLTDSPDAAAFYARDWGRNEKVIPAVTSGEYQANSMRDAFLNVGRDGLDVDYGMRTDRAVTDPSNIRSRFARFDPEFRHLANLSAGLGAVGLLGSINRDDLDRETAAYLGGI